MGRDAGQARPRDPRHVLAMSADLDKAQAEGVELDVGTGHKVWAADPPVPRRVKRG